LYLKYPIRIVQENQVELKFRGTLQLLFYVDDENQFETYINTLKITESLIDLSKYGGLEVNIEKAKYTFMFLTSMRTE
jgi:hypothetical protein